jgi:hypothetical protein
MRRLYAAMHAETMAHLFLCALCVSAVNFFNRRGAENAE